VALREQLRHHREPLKRIAAGPELLMSEKEVTLPTMQVSELSSHFAIAQAQRAEAEAQLQQANDAVRSSGVGRCQRVLNSGLIQSLREKEAALMDTAAELSSRYGKDHPDIAAIRSQLETTRQKLGLEVDRVIDGLHNQVRAAQIRGEHVARSFAGS